MTRACMHGWAIIQSIEQLGVWAMVDRVNGAGRTALWLACEKGHTHVAR